jgi:glycosyltransferase involved in cell wall biosynthesis
MSLQNLKIALVCDWLTTPGGAERVIKAMHDIFPNAPIYTALYNPKKVRGFENADVRTSYLQKIPFAKNHHQMLLPWMPEVFESMNLDEYDIVISSSHSCAKGIVTKPTTLHICYCHSPMRYAWDNHHAYVNEYEMNPIMKKIGRTILHNIRMWDRLAAERVDAYCTNSHFVQKRIQKYYRKVADVIHPPVDTKKFNIERGEKEYYLAIGRLTSYKKFNIIVEAFNALEKPLIIAGTGVEEKKLRAKAKKNITFIGHVPESEIAHLYAGAKALIFPQIEDFGITPLESMASGRPVIAFKEGGALETVKEGVTGLFFKEQNAVGIVQAVHEFERSYKEFSPEKIREHAMKFSLDTFKEKFLSYTEDMWRQYTKQK